MIMIKGLDPVQLTPKQIALKELEEEQKEKSVKLLKDKLLQLRKAQQVVSNLEREVEDLEQRINDGNV